MDTINGQGITNGCSQIQLVLDLELAINLVIWIILLTFNCFKDPVILSLSLHWRQMHKGWQALWLSKYVEETGFAELTDGHWEVFVVDCSHLAYHSDSVEVRHPAVMEVLPAVSELAMLAVAKMRALSQTHYPVHKYPKVELSIGDWQITGLTNKQGYSFLYWNKSGQDCNPLLSFLFDSHNSKLSRLFSPRCLWDCQWSVAVCRSHMSKKT